MKKIIVLCAFFLVIVAAVLGLMVIFGMMGLDTALSNMLKFGGAIVLLGIAAALIGMMMGSQEKSE